MGRPVPHTVQQSGRSITIWGDTDELDELFENIEPDADGIGTLSTVSVRSTTVRRYPGGPTFTRRAHTRTVDSEKGLAGGATPGQRFWIERDEGLPGFTEKKTSQFTFVGPVFALKRWVRANGTPGHKLRTPGGRAIEITAPD